ncbi:MAG TPA: sulfotransferase [Dehalococcoidia bacterium]|nr:sulfotransferase [Dehalococcoidia bacterium]
MIEPTAHARAPMEATLPAPIFIFGVTQRSGTHFLYDLLLRHPQCRAALSRTSWEGSWEDHLVEFSGYLSLYAKRVVETNRLNDASTYPLLMRSLGIGIEVFLRDYDGRPHDPRRPVTKSPVTAYLDVFAELFPGAPAVLLVRDARAVVASALNTFGGRADRWILEWRSGARRFARFQQQHPGAAVVVRYEDLYGDTEQSLRSLFTRLGLDEDSYDYASIPSMPVRGSSQHGDPNVTWHPKPRTADFTPLRRAEWLTLEIERRIAWRVADEMETFGYERPAARYGAAEQMGQRIWSARTRMGVTIGEWRAKRHSDRIFERLRRSSASHWS